MSTTPTDNRTASELLDTELLLTREECGRVLRVSENTVRGLYRVGELSGILVGKKHLRFRAVDIRRFVEGLGANECD